MPEAPASEFSAELLRERLGDFTAMVDEDIPHARRVALFLKSLGTEFSEATDTEIAAAEAIVPTSDKLVKSGIAPTRPADAAANYLVPGYLKLERADLARDIRDRLEETGPKFTRQYVAKLVYESTRSYEDLPVWIEAVQALSDHEQSSILDELVGVVLEKNQMTLTVDARTVEAIRPLIRDLPDYLARADYFARLAQLGSVN